MFYLLFNVVMSKYVCLFIGGVEVFDIWGGRYFCGDLLWGLYYYLIIIRVYGFIVL